MPGPPEASEIFGVFEGPKTAKRAEKHSYGFKDLFSLNKMCTARRKELYTESENRDFVDTKDSTLYLFLFSSPFFPANHACGAQRRRFFWAALFHWPDFLAHFLKKLNAAERPMFLFSTLFSQILSFSSRGADFLKKCVLSCGSLQ